MREIKIKLDISELAQILFENLTDDDIIYLIKELDDSACSWDFTHKGFMYFKSVIDGNKREYQDFLEDMDILERPTPSIEDVINNMEDI